MKPMLRVIFDRKNKASETTSALIQIEVYFKGKRKYISTGVKVKSNEWDKDRNRVVGSNDDFNNNYYITSLLKKIDDFIVDCDRNNDEFSLTKLDAFLQGGSDGGRSFLQYYLERVSMRKMKHNTHKKMVTTYNHIVKFGKLKTFSDFTPANIKNFDYYLSECGLSKSSVYQQHKQLKWIINDAVSDGFIKQTPYLGMKIPRGKHKDPVFLLENEIESIKNHEFSDEKIEKVRDLYIFQCFTGLSYSDLADFKKSDIREIDGKKVLSSNRKKTDESFITLLLPDAEKILEKYDYVLPVISNQKYNDYLKVLASYVGINKRLTTHTARHTYATYLLNRGISIATVSRVMGHSKINQTQHYAKLLGKTVIDEMSNLL